MVDKGKLVFGMMAEKCVSSWSRRLRLLRMDGRMD